MNKEYKQTVKIVKMKMFAIVYLAPSRDSMVDTIWTMPMHSEDISLLTNYSWLITKQKTILF